MTNPQMSAAEAPAAPAEELIEITDDMILELAPHERRGKLLYLPPPLPRPEQAIAPARPATPARRRRRGLFPVIED